MISSNNHTDAPSRERDDETDSQKDCVARPVPEYIRYDAGIDGSRWHPVATVDEADCRANDVIVTECGLRVQWIDAEAIVEADEERPHMSGNEICYGCAR